MSLQQFVSTFYARIDVRMAHLLSAMMLTEYFAGDLHLILLPQELTKQSRCRSLH